MLNLHEFRADKETPLYISQYKILTFWNGTNTSFNFFYRHPKDVTFLAPVLYPPASLIFHTDDFDGRAYGGLKGHCRTGTTAELASGRIISEYLGGCCGPRGRLYVSIILSAPGIMQCL